MDKIPKIEEFMTKFANEHSYNTWDEMMYDTHGPIQIKYTAEMTKAYTKLHVKAALRAAANPKVIPAFDKPGKTWVSKEDILSAYPLESIK